MKFFGKPLELVILDVDGVILDLPACFQRNLEMAAAILNLPIAPIRQYLTAMRDGDRVGHASIKDGARIIWPWLSTKEAAFFVKCFREEEQLHPYPPVPGSVETIRWFCDRRIPLALCTTNERDRLADRLRVAGVDFSWFAAASTWESRFRKPDPRALDEIFETVRVPRDHTGYVGDWYPDIDVARGAGVRFIAVLSGGIPRHAFLREGVPEDHILERLVDLPKLIQDD